MKSQMTDFAFGRKCSCASRMLPKASMPRPPPALLRNSRLVDISKLVQGEEDVTEVDEVQPRSRVEFFFRRFPAECPLEGLLRGLGAGGEGFGAVADEGVVEQRERLG